MEKLNILWTTNKETIFNMLAMYAVNAKAKKWWEKVNVIIWGASAQLIGEDEEVQSLITTMLNQGVSVEACKACSDNLGVTDILKKLGVTVKYMGEPLTGYLKHDEKILTL